MNRYLYFHYHCGPLHYATLSPVILAAESGAGRWLSALLLAKTLTVTLRPTAAGGSARRPEQDLQENTLSVTCNTQQTYSKMLLTSLLTDGLIWYKAAKELRRVLTHRRKRQHILQHMQIWRERRPLHVHLLADGYVKRWGWTRGSWWLHLIPMKWVLSCGTLLHGGSHKSRGFRRRNGRRS